MLPGQRALCNALLMYIKISQPQKYASSSVESGRLSMIMELKKCYCQGSQRNEWTAEKEQVLASFAL